MTDIVKQYISYFSAVMSMCKHFDDNYEDDVKKELRITIGDYCGRGMKTMAEFSHEYPNLAADDMVRAIYLSFNGILKASNEDKSFERLRQMAKSCNGIVRAIGGRDNEEYDLMDWIVFTECDPWFEKKLKATLKV